MPNIELEKWANEQVEKYVQYTLAHDFWWNKAYELVGTADIQPYINRANWYNKKGISVFKILAPRLKDQATDKYLEACEYRYRKVIAEKHNDILG